MKKTKTLKEIGYILLTLLASAMSALGIYYFVYSAKFAPAGVEGIATMLWQITGLNAGIFSLIFNLPLLIAAWFILKRRYVIYTLLFTFISSGLLMMLEEIGFPTYGGEEGTLIAAIFSGVILGVRTGLMLRLGASTGGIDIIAGMIQAKRPHLNVERVITVICYGTILLSYLYYREIGSILLSFVQMFVFDVFAGRMLKDRRNAIEVMIVTDEPDRLREALIYKLKHGATVINAKGMYTDGARSLIISVINIRQIPELTDIMKEFPTSFTYYSEVSGIRGNFRWKKDDVAK